MFINIGNNENAKYWLSVLNELKNCGVKDILIICTEGLSGIKEAIMTAFPKTEYQRCIVHQVRNTLKYVLDTGMLFLRYLNFRLVLEKLFILQTLSNL